LKLGDIGLAVRQTHRNDQGRITVQATIHSVRDAVLSRAEALSSHEADFAQFLKTAILAGAAEDLVGLSPDWLEAVLRRTSAHVVNYGGTTSSIILTPPETASAPLVIDIISPDMPFIVDSALAAVRAAGGTIRLFAHPVIQQGVRALSVLHIQSDPVSDVGAKRAEL
jgi:glutamate dehydrogenase